MVYEVVIKNAQANYNVKLIKSGGGQSSNYVGINFFRDALEKNVIYETSTVEGYPGGNRASDKKYLLNDDYEFELGSGALDLIGEEYKDNNKFIVSYPQTKDPKPQLNRRVYEVLSREDKGYEWFVKLYDSNISYNKLIFDIQEGKLILDVKFSAIKKYLSSEDTSQSDEYADIGCPYNRIVFGAPGTGKSFKLNKDKKIFGDRYERVTFHPNYSYSQFVGTYKPVPVKDKDGNKTNEITYKYIPGPFMRAYVEAANSKEPYLLLIEEINRANVTSVFGDIFQLLDRENGVSEYPIETSEDMRDYLDEKVDDEDFDSERIVIPKNMYIWASMNSADQGVFPMDTAFKRRWEFEYIGINDNSDEIKNITVAVGNDNHIIKWNDLRTSINNKLTEDYKINEDKLLGPYFLSKEILDSEEESDTEILEWESKPANIKDNDKFLKAFKSKVLMYLFEDVAKQYGPKLFSGCDDPTKYSSICKEFDEKGESIFGDDFIDKYADDEDE